MLEADLLEVQDDLNDVFEHARKGCEFVFRTADFHGSDGCAFKGGKEDAAEGVPNRVTVTLSLIHIFFSAAAGVSPFCLAQRLR